MMRAITYLGKHVGNVEGATFTTRRRPEHFFRKFNGFGLSTQLLHQLKAMNVQHVVILYEHPGGTERYTAYVNQFFAQGEHWTDRTADTQLILGLEHMKR